jgi:hypothetical protein
VSHLRVPLQAVVLERFSAERKVVLGAIRDALRQHDWTPTFFDFDAPLRIKGRSPTRAAVVSPIYRM